MLTHGGASAEKAITATERHFVVSLKVDWDRDGSYDHALTDVSGYAVAISTDRSLKGAMPEELSLIEGAGAAELSFTLEGDHNGMPLAALFSPYNPGSPFWKAELVGCEVMYWLGVQSAVGIVWYSQFVGNLRTVEPDRGSGQVVFTALDRVELLRKPVRFPLFAMSDYHANRGRRVEQLIESQWVIDHCLRTSGISPTPNRAVYVGEPGIDNYTSATQLWVSGSGGFLPSIGWLDNYEVLQFPEAPSLYTSDGPTHPDSDEPTKHPRAFVGFPGNTENQLKYWYADRNASFMEFQHGCGFTLITRGPNATEFQTAATHNVVHQIIGAKYVITLKIGDSGKVWTEFYSGQDGVTWVSPKLTIPTGADYQEIACIWQPFNPSGVQVYLECGSLSTGPGWTTVASPLTFTDVIDDLKGLVTVDRNENMADIFAFNALYSYLTSPTFLINHIGSRAAQYAAVLDEGRNRFSFMPTRQAADAWEVIADVASAELGAVFWDEEGRFKFWNRDTLNAKRNNPVRTLTLDEVTGLRITHTLDSVRNVVSVEEARRSGGMGVVWESDNVDQFFIPPATEISFKIWTDGVMCPIPFKLTRFSTDVANPYGVPIWGDTIGNGYVVQYLISGVWQEFDANTSGVDITTRFDPEGFLVIRVWNGYPYATRFVTDKNQPALRVWGSKMTDSPAKVTISKDAASIVKYKAERNLRISGDWVQEQVPGANVLGPFILEKTAVPVPATDAITMAGDPRLQLGDALRISDPSGFGGNIPVQIYGVRRDWSIDDGLEDTLTVELARPGAGIWDDPDYGIWDSTFAWS